MLIKVFGIWLMAANIQYLSPDLMSSDGDDMSRKGCYIKYVKNGDVHLRIKDHSCDETATEINNQLKVKHE